MPSSSDGRSGKMSSAMSGMSGREAGHGVEGREVIGGKVYGTIFMGPESERETTLDKLYSATQREQWSRQTENEYMERVRARATERVRGLLLQARRRGEALEAEARERAEQIVREAEAIRAGAERERGQAEEKWREAEERYRQAEKLRSTAQEDGLAAGRAQAREELAQAREELGNATGAVLIGIQEQCAAIFAAWRGDLAALVREVAEKGTGLVIKDEREKVLSALLDQSMRALLDRRSFSVRVNPEDADLVRDILSDARHVNPRVSTWEVVRDPALEPGSLVVESESALVDNSRAARSSVVDEVLAHLEIPQSDADQAATEQVTQTLIDNLRNVGVDVTEEGGDSEGTASEHTPESSPGGRQADAAPDGERADMFAEHDAPQLSPADGLDDAVPATETPLMESGFVSGNAPQNSSESLFENLPQNSLQNSDDSDGEVEPAQTQAAPQSAPDPDVLSGTEANDLVEAFLGDPPGDGHLAGDGHPLPDIVADELLADMGFASETKPHSGG